MTRPQDRKKQDPLLETQGNASGKRGCVAQRRQPERYQIYGQGPHGVPWAHVAPAEPL
jgi:hypothetical protein